MHLFLEVLRPTPKYANVAYAYLRVTRAIPKRQPWAQKVFEVTCDVKT